MTLLRYGPNAWLLRFAERADEAAFDRSRQLVAGLEHRPPAGLAESVPAFTTLLLRFAGPPPGETEIRRWLDSAAADSAASAPAGRQHELPVHYAGPDLARIATHAGLPVAEVIARHSAITYRVHCLGFGPGFPYLGGLDPKLHTPRLASPRPRVLPGSVAIGGEHTGIYTVASPGGWNLLGQTAVTLFDPRATSVEAMFRLRAGDSVRFRTIPGPPAQDVIPAKLPPERLAANPRLRIRAAGLGVSLQDLGRPGYGQFGVPPGGAMAPSAASVANRLLDNPSTAAVLELCLQGQRLEVLADGWLAVAGSTAPREQRPNSAFRVRAGDLLEFPPGADGVWTYVAIPGGFDGHAILGSRSANPRAGLGRTGAPGDEFAAATQRHLDLPAAIARRTLPAAEDIRDSAAPLRVWPAPQWESFSAETRARLFSSDWIVSSQCDRVGYRLQGPALEARSDQIISEPVLPGSIQVPAGGQPIVTMPDGPTIGGYPKLGLVDPADLPRLAQRRPSQRLRFQPVG
jgi:KipI family sensor histidine kinase inhibitor